MDCYRLPTYEKSALTEAGPPDSARPFPVRFRDDTNGAIAGIYAIALFALVASAGVAWDWTRLSAMHSELQNAADQAALAGAAQLDGEAGTCSRASAAAVTMLTNSSLLSNDAEGSGSAITVTSEPACDAIGNIRFYKDRNRTTAATSDDDAKFIQVTVDGREAFYAFTPVVGALSSDEVVATALAGLGSSVCKVPPIMICNPDPDVDFDADSLAGIGVVATGHATGAGTVGHNTGGGADGNAGSQSKNTWAPGDFGFLQVEDADINSKNGKLLKALAYNSPPIDCVNIDNNKVSTGNPQNLYDAINTRFGIYDFNSNGGTVLSPCEGGACSPAPNVKSDFTRVGSGCKISNAAGNGGNGFKLPASGSEFAPKDRGAYNPNSFFNDTPPSAMGLPRDNCHYETYNGTGTCSGSPNGRFGNGEWARQDYFSKNHPSSRPSNWQTITRHGTYVWELGGHLPSGGAPVCGTPAGDASRRELTVAIVSNCADLNGTSTNVEIEQWADVFLVEPSTDDARRHNKFKDAIYMEIIGESKIAGNGTFGTQSVRRDVPYLVR